MERVHKVAAELSTKDYDINHRGEGQDEDDKQTETNLHRLQVARPGVRILSASQKQSKHETLPS